MLTSPYFCAFGPFRPSSLFGKINEGMKTAVVGRSFFARWSVSLLATGISSIGVVSQIAFRVIQGVGLLLGSLFLIPFSEGRNLLKRFATQSWIDLTAIGRIGFAILSDILIVFSKTNSDSLFGMAPSAILSDGFDYYGESECCQHFFELARKRIGFNQSEINQADEQGKRPLCYALTNETMNIKERYAWVKGLLKIGAKADYRDNDRLSPLNKFFLRGGDNPSMEVLESLLLAGASLNDERVTEFVEKQMVKNLASQIVDKEIEKIYKKAEEGKKPLPPQLLPDLEVVFKNDEYKLVEKCLSNKRLDVLDYFLRSYPRFDVDGFDHGGDGALTCLIKSYWVKDEKFLVLNRLIAAGAKLDRPDRCGHIPIGSLFVYRRNDSMFKAILGDLLRAGSPRTWPSIFSEEKKLIDEVARQVLPDEVADHA